MTSFLIKKDLVISSIIGNKELVDGERMMRPLDKKKPADTKKPIDIYYKQQY